MPPSPADTPTPPNAVFEPARHELLCLLERMTGTLEGSLDTPIEGLYLHRISQPTGPKPALQKAALAVIAFLITWGCMSVIQVLARFAPRSPNTR